MIVDEAALARARKRVAWDLVIAKREAALAAAPEAVTEQDREEPDNAPAPEPAPSQPARAVARCVSCGVEVDVATVRPRVVFCSGPKRDKNIGRKCYAA